MSLMSLFRLTSMGVGSSATTRFVLPTLSRAKLKSGAKSFLASTAEFAAYSYIVETTQALWEEENGTIPVGYDLIISLIAPALLGKAVRWGNIKGKGSIPSSAYSGEFRRDIASLPMLSGIKNQLTQQTKVRNFSMLRDVELKTLTVGNSRGQSVFSFHDGKFKLSKRIKLGILATLGVGGLAGITAGGGTAEGLAALFSSDGIKDTQVRYLGLLAQSLEDAAGIDSDGVRGVDEVKVGGRWYEDIGRLHKEILTNTRSVISDIMFHMGVDSDVADDVVSYFLTNSAEYVRSKAVKAVDVTGKQVEVDEKTFSAEVEELSGDPKDGGEESFFETSADYLRTINGYENNAANDSESVGSNTRNGNGNSRTVGFSTLGIPSSGDN